MARKSGGGLHHPSSKGGNRRLRNLTTGRKRTGEKGISAYEAKRTKPYSQTMPVPVERIRHRFNGFQRIW